MLLRQFAKIPVGIIAFVAASSAVEKYSKYNLSLFCYSSVICMPSSWCLVHENRQDVSKHCKLRERNLTVLLLDKE